MWANPEEARSDFVLAAAAAVLGPLLLRLLAPLGLRALQGRGPVGAAFFVLVAFAFTGLVPLLLARHRGEGLAAFGLDAPRQAMSAGLLAAVPLVAVGMLQWWAVTRSLPKALTGVFAQVIDDPFGLVFAALGSLALFVGSVLLFTFLTVKARDGFARTELAQLQMLRTLGLAAAGAGAVVGLLLLPIRRIALGAALLEPLALAAVVLLADRLVQPRVTTSRAAILGPVIVALLLQLELFGGAFLTSLREGLLAAGLVVVVAVLVETRQTAWAVVPLFAAVSFYAVSFRPVL
ncbi:MAG: hypothetical protein M3O70_17460 [Actinomycetota bacterium]|nr:hypothetical protein [Actinomycetota bacterium]